MDAREALYTTRAMRRMRPDPIPREVQARIMDAAIRAPSGGNRQDWRFLMTDDRATIAALAPIYRESIAELWAGAYKPLIDQAGTNPDAPASRGTRRLVDSVQYMADHFEDVPLLLFGFSGAGSRGNAVDLALWSAQLAARIEGIGSSIVSAMLAYRRERTLAAIGVPEDCGYTATGIVGFGYPTGRWGVAPRTPVHEVTWRDRWGAPFGTEIPAPLWP
ncbi:MAG: nitroreductase family protein [Gammaproteobacteria bacterium]